MDHYCSVPVRCFCPVSGVKHHKYSAAVDDSTSSVFGSKPQTPEVTSTPTRTSSLRRKSSAELIRGVSSPTEPLKNRKVDHVIGCIPDSTQPPVTDRHHPHHHHNQPSVKRSRMNGSRRSPCCSRCSCHQKILNVDEGRGFQHQMDHHNRLPLLPPAVHHSSLYSGFEGRPVCPDGGTWCTPERGLSSVAPIEQLRDLFTHPATLPLLPGDVRRNGRIYPHQIMQSQQRQELEKVSN